jgi:hypothetical protein
MTLDHYIEKLQAIQKQAGKRPLRVVRDSDVGWRDVSAPKVTTVEMSDLASSEFMAALPPGSLVVEI